MTRLHWLAWLCAFASFGAREAGAEARRYVGISVCRGCHEAEGDAFTKLAGKSRSYAAVQKMARELTAAETQECYGCHTTGYGKPGGFRSLEETPDLANVGCESCHGPGSAHAESGSREAIVLRPPQTVCDACHTESRVRAFNYRPLRYAGAH